MARVLNQEATSEEREELADAMQEDAILQQQFELLSRVWQDRVSLLDDEAHAQASVQCNSLSTSEVGEPEETKFSIF